MLGRGLGGRRYLRKGGGFFAFRALYMPGYRDRSRLAVVVDYGFLDVQVLVKYTGVMS